MQLTIQKSQNIELQLLWICSQFRRFGQVTLATAFWYWHCIRFIMNEQDSLSSMKTQGAVLQFSASSWLPKHCWDCSALQVLNLPRVPTPHRCEQSLHSDHWFHVETGEQQNTQTLMRVKNKKNCRFQKILTANHISLDGTSSYWWKHGVTEWNHTKPEREMRRLFPYHSKSRRSQHHTRDQLPMSKLIGLK